MAFKKIENTDNTNTAPEVDMERIKAMMGPLPNEGNDIVKKPHSSKFFKRAAENAKGSVSAAAEEANATLKAMSPSLGESVITKVDEASEAIPVRINQENPAKVKASVADSTESTVQNVVDDDPVIVKAVDEIVAHEGDEVLAAEDKKLGTKTKLPKVGFRERLKDLWARKNFRRGVIIGSGIVILLIAIVPYSRYFILNVVGIRASLTVKVVDASTLQPLKNVEVVISGVSSQTNVEGTATVSRVKLGGAKVVVSKRAFATIEKSVTVGWGSNPQGELRMQPAGAKYNFIVSDFLSNKPIAKAEAMSGEGSAIADKDGKISLILDTSSLADSDPLNIQVTLDGYRSELISITAGNKETNSVKLVPDKKDVFVSKRSGKYDVYAIDLDGKNEKKLVTATGIERDDMGLVQQQNGNYAAYVATRENVKNSDGYLLSTLYLLDTKTGALTKIDQSEQIQLIGWSSTQHLVYVKIAAGTSGSNPKRHRLMSLNAKTITDNKELASANSFNDVLMAGDRVLYAPSNAFRDGTKSGLFVINADGTSALSVTNQEVYNIFRTDYETVTVNVAGSKYFTYKIGLPAATLASISNASDSNRLYIDSVNALNPSLWLDTRDGKNLLLTYDKATKKDKTLVTKPGIKPPMYWVNESTVVFRVNDGKETANYVVSVDGGEAKKIQDVTDTSGIGRWYYY